MRSMLARVCACVNATASASAAPACIFVEIFNNMPTMCWIWPLPAPPVPTTACLISFGAYSVTVRPRRKAFAQPRHVIRILGIDPGSQRTGVGIIDADAGGATRHVFHMALQLLDNETLSLI